MINENKPVIVAAFRTPQARKNGYFSEVRGEDLSVAIINHTLEKTGVDPKRVDDLLWGCAMQREEQDNNVARIIALMSALGEKTAASTINRWCASSLQAIMSASDSIAAGQRDCIIAGGVEHMTRVSMEEKTAYENFHPEFVKNYNLFELHMGMTAESVASKYNISRRDQDEYALRSHQKAIAAHENGHYKDEIVPIHVGENVRDVDEGMRKDTSMEKLSKLSPVFRSDGTVTAGNSSQISDGAAVTMVTSAEFAEENGLEILASIENHAVAGVDPKLMGIGPIYSTKKMLARTGGDISDFGLVEMNEAFASQCIHCQRELKISEKVFNLKGGAIAMGHPLGATGARLPVTLIHEMKRQNIERGLVTMCVGLGQGASMSFSRQGLN